MAREQMNVRIKREIRDEFKKLCEEQGLSTCFVLESLLIAWIEGLKAPARAKVDGVATITINQKFERVIKRGRRTYKAYEPDSNFYNRKNNDWEYRSGPINDFGHAVGCSCSECTSP